MGLALLHVNAQVMDECADPLPQEAGKNCPIRHAAGQQCKSLWVILVTEGPRCQCGIEHCLRQVAAQAIDLVRVQEFVEAKPATVPAQHTAI